MDDRQKKVKQKLLESAGKEFAILGYDKANINNISLKAGFGKGTIYNYFKNKEDLLIELIGYAANQVAESTKEKISNETDVLKKLYFDIYSHFEFFINNESLLKVLIKEGYSASPKIQKKILESMNFCYQITMEIIEEGKKQKIFSKDIDSFTCANILAGMLFHHDCTCWALNKKITDPAMETKIIYNFFLHGLLPKSERTKS